MSARNDSAAYACPRGHRHYEGSAFCTVCGAGPVLLERATERPLPTKPDPALIKYREDASIPGWLLPLPFVPAAIAVGLIAWEVAHAIA